MSNYWRANTKGSTCFFTVVTYRRQRFLCNENVRNALREGIKATQATHPFTIDAWLVFRKQVHRLKFYRKYSGDDVLRRNYKQINQLKRDEWMNRSKRKRNESTIWQRHFGTKPWMAVD